MSKYICVDCVHYMKCPVNAGLKMNYVTDCKITYLEERKKNHILVFECNNFKQRDVEKGSILHLPREQTRSCRVCGREFVISRNNRYICSNPKCKEISNKFRKSRQRKGV